MNYEEKISVGLIAVLGINSLADLNAILEFTLLSFSILSAGIGIIKHWRKRGDKK